MANKKFDDVRERVMKDVKVLLEGLQFDVLKTGSQELCVPVVSEDGEEGYMVVTFKIPSGSRDGDAYDGYAVAQEYEMKCEAKKKKAEESAKKKAAKIAADKAKREAKKKAE